ncbi:tRNA 2-thiouridine(34) synthase MnmA [Elongatibacter sediminis]|uniref:tRNA-specific 2-thiouridylase MnmA n=1 Tax=Elongatibacter sediminis TaxID=3119006 RepID=A0AAW9RL62_9GAMM
MTRTGHSSELTVVAMSGGVDSSVSALLMHEQGRPLAGMFMKNWEEDDRDGTCPAEADAADAQAVADRIGITLHRRNFAAEYWDNVFEEFLDEYRAGRTPNPDILCNREIKFRTFLDHARDLGAERIATGHYVRVRSTDDGWQLLRGRDSGKDQSYFLYTLGQDQLACTDFPVGELPKSSVRDRAAAAGFGVHDKKDSTGICFIGERDFRGFLARYIEPCPGDIRTPEGQVLGEHQGLMFHTLGQRQGLGIGGVRGFPDAPWYVLHKDIDENVLFVGQQHDHPWLMSRQLTAGQTHWISGQAPAAGTPVQAQVRYRQNAQAATVAEAGNGRLRLVFEQPQRAVTPGQSVVVYSDEVCLGGGIIDACDAPPAGPLAAVNGGDTA